MAYMFQSSVKDRDLLDYDLEGGNPEFTIEGLEYEGRPLKGADLATCMWFSLRAPPALVATAPTRINVKPGRDGFIPDFGMTGDVLRISSALVSDRFVALVERLEPNAHQFIPIKECVDRQGRPLGRPFFLMNVLARLEAIDIERSEVQWQTTRYPDETELTVLVRGPRMNSKLVLKRDIVKGHHLWRGGRNGLIGSYFMSEELHDSMSQVGLSPLGLTRCEEV